MNRDNALFALMGLVLGFVLAYPVFEAMSSRQPALRQPGQAGGMPPATGAPAGGGAGGPAVEDVRRLREYVEANPEDADAVRALAELNLQVQDRVRARELFERYVELRPDDKQAVLLLANLHFDTQRFAAARERYEQYLATEPGNPDILTDLGVSYRNLGEHRRALELFRQAQEMAPSHWVSRYNEVVVLAFDLDPPDFAAAGRVLEDLRDLQPDNPDVAKLAAEVERLQAASGA